MKPLLITNAYIINEYQKYKGAVLIDDEKIIRIFRGNEIPSETINSSTLLDAKEKTLIPGVIDDHVHFREPGLTHKADINSESVAAVAGGITSYCEMPNTKPQTTSHRELKKKHEIAAKSSLANYSFYLGATNENIKEIEKVDPSCTCGIKLFMGASTGNMLVDNSRTLDSIFAGSPTLIACHCEDEATIKNNLAYYKNKFGDNIPISYHSKIRSEEACYKSSSLAVSLAKKHNSRLHILHTSTAKELELFDELTDRKHKKITSEVCVHHLWFDDNDYDKLGTKIKWNPAIKTQNDRLALVEGLKKNKIDLIGTDHAPHQWIEKDNNYVNAPSGGPMIQHSLQLMLEFYHKGLLTIENIVDKMCHAPSDLFNIDKRGYLREGYWADLVLLDLNNSYKVQKENILYKCGWSPLEGQTFKSTITHTFVNGHLVYENGTIHQNNNAKALKFNR
jgi:dihydroorotase